MFFQAFAKTRAGWPHHPNLRLEAEGPLSYLARSGAPSALQSRQGVEMRPIFYYHPAHFPSETERLAA